MHTTFLPPTHLYILPIRTPFIFTPPLIPRRLELTDAVTESCSYPLVTCRSFFRELDRARSASAVAAACIIFSGLDASTPPPPPPPPSPAQHQVQLYAWNKQSDVEEFRSVFRVESTRLKFKFGDVGMLRAPGTNNVRCQRPGCKMRSPLSVDFTAYLISSRSVHMEFDGHHLFLMFRLSVRRTGLILSLSVYPQAVVELQLAVPGTNNTVS